MNNPFGEHEDFWIAYGDFLTTLLGIFLICTVLLIPFLNPQAKSEAEGNTKSPGNIIIETIWHEDDVDVDTWAQAPGDIIVGYSSKSGKVLNLLRDDLGYVYEKIGDVHFENIYSRGMPAGEYVVNVHMYRNNKHYPIEVEVNVEITKNPGDLKEATKKVIKTKVLLEKFGQELTAVRFRIDQDQNVVEGSVNNIYKPLRSAKPETPSVPPL